MKLFLFPSHLPFIKKYPYFAYNKENHSQITAVMSFQISTENKLSQQMHCTQSEAFLFLQTETKKKKKMTVIIVTPFFRKSPTLIPDLNKPVYNHYTKSIVTSFQSPSSHKNKNQKKKKKTKKESLSQ